MKPRTRRIAIVGQPWEKVAPAQAISRMIDNPLLARAMGEAGRKRVLERFTWEASARRLANLIERPARNS